MPSLCAGNHGEDAKEYWWYEDNLPSHAYMRASYLYPMAAFPYEKLVEGNAARNREEPELELMEACKPETWDRSLFWLVTVEYAKAGQRDIVQRITARNASDEAQELHMLPTAYFRNTWSWGYNGEMPWVAEVQAEGPLAGSAPPRATPVVAASGGQRQLKPRAAPTPAVEADAPCTLVGWERHLGLIEITTSPPHVVDATGATVHGAASFAAKSRCKDKQQGAALVTDNNTNFAAVWGEDGSLLNPCPVSQDALPCNLWGGTAAEQGGALGQTWFSKDGVQEAVLRAHSASAPKQGTASVKPTGSRGTKAAVWAHATVPAGGEFVLVTRLRIAQDKALPPPAVRPQPTGGGGGGTDVQEDGGAAAPLDAAVAPQSPGGDFADAGPHEDDSGDMGGPTIPQRHMSSLAQELEAAAAGAKGGGAATPQATVPDTWYSTPTAIEQVGDAVTVASLQAVGLRNQLSTSGAEHVILQRKGEADEFYGMLAPDSMSPPDRSIQRQAFAGLLWGKQYYHFGVAMWLKGDPSPPPPPPQRAAVRNSDWSHMYCSDVISMPDKWEYPWFASWDLAFHMIPLALIGAYFQAAHPPALTPLPACLPATHMHLQTRIGPSASCCWSCESGTCTPLGSCRRMSGTTGILTPLCTPGRCFAYSALTASSAPRLQHVWHDQRLAHRGMVQCSTVCPLRHQWRQMHSPQAPSTSSTTTTAQDPPWVALWALVRHTPWQTAGTTCGLSAHFTSCC